MNGPGGIDVAWIGQQFPGLTNVQLLSRGGQKLVFSANHDADGKVVLKLIHPRQDLETTTREVLAVTQVGSARVPQILDQGRLPTPIGDCIWLREQRVMGDSLRDVITSGPLPPEQLVRLGIHVLETLVAAEEANIVHRDVKPENIIRDLNHDFWLLDFGIARHLDLQSLTATASPFGKVTWGYSPPEQCRNIKPNIDARADLFALGVTLHESATGINLFRDGASNPLEILRRVETLQLSRLQVTLHDAESFADLIAAMTQRRRDHRPSSAADALQWMTEIQNAEAS